MHNQVCFRYLAKGTFEQTLFEDDERKQQFLTVSTHLFIQNTTFKHKTGAQRRYPAHYIKLITRKS